MNFDERDTVATQFGVANEQVERNHLISHLLAFLSRQFGDPIHFIGGTALARTHLPVAVSARTSISSRWATASKLRKTWTLRPRAVARSHGRLTVEPELITTADTVPVLLRPADGRPVRLQLLSPRDRILWPTELRALVRRYADDPPAELLAPTDRVRRIEDCDMGRPTRSLRWWSRRPRQTNTSACLLHTPRYSRTGYFREWCCRVSW